MTLSELITDVRSRLDEDVAGFWTDAEITRWLNEANLRVAALLEDLQDIDLQTTVALQADYTLPTDLLRLARVQHDSIPLSPITFSKLNENESSGLPSTSVSGTPEAFYVWAGKIYLYPAPASAVVNGLRIFYVKQPAALVNVGDEPEHAEHLHYLLPLYACYLGYQKDMCRLEMQNAYGQFREGIDDAREWFLVGNNVEYGQLIYKDD